MIKLETFTTNDTPVMINWNFSADELFQFGGDAFTHPLQEEQIVDFLKTENSMFFKAIDTESDVVIGVGEIVLMEDNIAKLARIVIGDRNSRGKGYGQRMMTVFVQYATEILKREKVILNVFEWNIGAIKCYKKIGFTFVNTPPRSFELPNGEIWYSKQMDYTRE
ncbi:Protein N-acetyltransferase, RimJ/RimL family [Myroides marinus]|uniref:Protein N-acetyltransferase, RimJ/RimL family n=1 Tax=Myroides marinus TaxID=703342 RepID=A0A165R2I4_9FLAO|nr:GNAT family protein [Myroides marinus]KZE78032.1 hypothetical protein AV926_13390 [Myroides marinus]SEI70439.1 Protein N-acetyltransferase, RimJ/RimL family [Myroides marinus]